MNVLDKFRPTPAKTLETQRRERALEQARRSLPEIKLGDLTFGRFGAVTHCGGDEFRLVRGVVDEVTASSATAFYVNHAGDAVYLESAGSREEKVAAREARRAAQQAERRARWARIKAGA
jgi:hypothetical protein